VGAGARDVLPVSRGGGAIATQEERSAATRQKLLDAAVEALIGCGHAKASLPEICRRAGVSRGAQLHHFPTRADLLAAAVEHLFALRMTEFRDRMGAAGPDRAKLLDTAWEIYTSGPLYAWMELVVASRVEPELREVLARVDARFGENAARLLGSVYPLPEGVSPVAAGRMITSLLDGLAMNHVVRRDDAAAREVLMLFLGLLRTLFSSRR
jgi:AcrR family transcriptional regulator